MSSFVMEHEGFEQLANELYAQWRNPRMGSLKHAIWLWLEMDRRQYDDAKATAAAIARRVDLLEVANWSATGQRYGEDESAPVRPLTVRSTIPHWSKTQLFKHLQCLRYQMSEGDIPTSKPYHDLERLIGTVAENIVDGTPEYERAAWDW